MQIIFFALFSGERRHGLIGSKHGRNFEVLYPNVVTMINMDMIGRLNADKSF